MQRGRFFMFVGVLLALMAVGLLLLMQRGGDETEEPSGEAGEGVETVVIATPTPAPPTPIPNPVVVAKQRIPRGTLLISDTINLTEWVSVESWPQSWLTQDALSSLDQVEGRITRIEIPRGTILTAQMLTDEAGDLLATGSDAALLIPPGRVAMAIPVDHISSVGWALERGDHVDVLVSFLMIDLDEQFQTQLPNKAASLVRITEEAEVIKEEGVTIIQGVVGRIEQDPFGQPLNVIPNEAVQRPRLVSQVTVRDAQVLNVGPWLPWEDIIQAEFAAFESFVEPAPDDTGTTEEEGGEEVDGAPSGGEGGAGETQTAVISEDVGALLKAYEPLLRHPTEPLLLVVSPQDALVLKWAVEQGAALHVVLRSYSDAGVLLPDTEAVTLQYMVTRFNMALPPGLPYGVEPAVFRLERSFLTLSDDVFDLSKLQWILQFGNQSQP